MAHRSAHHTRPPSATTSTACEKRHLAAQFLPRSSHVPMDCPPFSFAPLTASMPGAAAGQRSTVVDGLLLVAAAAPRVCTSPDVAINMTLLPSTNPAAAKLSPAASTCGECSAHALSEVAAHFPAIYVCACYRRIGPHVTAASVRATYGARVAALRAARKLRLAFPLWTSFCCRARTPVGPTSAACRSFVAASGGTSTSCAWPWNETSRRIPAL